jgi:hypothetical protein
MRLKTFGSVQATISHHLKDPHSKALEPDCLSPFACDYDPVPGGEGERQGEGLDLTNAKDSITLEQNV